MQVPDWHGQPLCKSLQAVPGGQLIRLTGVYTDGGVDELTQKYAVDNLFSASRWQSYCSELGSNVHCCAVFLVRMGSWLVPHHSSLACIPC